VKAVVYIALKNLASVPKGAILTSTFLQHFGQLPE